MSRHLLTAAVVAALLGACGGHEACADEADCPRTVSFEGRDYVVSCEAVPRRLAGDPVDVTDDDERELGPAYGVDGYELRGVDPEEAIVVDFEQEVCDEGGLHLAYRWEVPSERVREIGRHLRRSSGGRPNRTM
ncbi:MAG TPA: hypothetical protein VHN37_05625 [Actinomycetota bacterium]|nr:hypothetical protein [Actinomycetota bacterium]